jgi:hypothetical protein
MPSSSKLAVPGEMQRAIAEWNEEDVLGFPSGQNPFSTAPILSNNLTSHHEPRLIVCVFPKRSSLQRCQPK